MQLMLSMPSTMGPCAEEMGSDVNKRLLFHLVGLGHFLDHLSQRGLESTLEQAVEA